MYFKVAIRDVETKPSICKTRNEPGLKRLNDSQHDSAYWNGGPASMERVSMG